MKIKANCGECSQEIVFLPTDTGAKMPVDVESLSELDNKYLNSYVSHNNPNEPYPVKYDPSRHRSHFKTCTNPSKFSKDSKDDTEKPRFTGYFVFQLIPKRDKTFKRSIQSKFKTDIVEISNIKATLEEASPSKQYFIGKRFKLGDETILEYKNEN